VSQSELHSIVVPMYNEESVAEEFIRRATAAFAGGEIHAIWELAAILTPASRRPGVSF